MNVLGRVVLKEELVVLTGDPMAAIVLNQFLYWSERTRDVDQFLAEEKKRNPELAIDPICGWIYKTTAELQDELMGLASTSTLRRRLIDLVKNGWLDERHNPKYKWDRTLQYRPNIQKIQGDLARLGYVLAGYPLQFEFQNEECIVHSEESNLQGESSILQAEESNLQGERAIPENTLTEITLTENTTSSTRTVDDDDVVSFLSKNGITGNVLLELSSKTTLQRAKAAYLASHIPEAQVKNRAGLIISLLQSDAPLPSDLMDLAALDKASFDWLAGHTKALQDSAVYDTWPDDMPETISDDQAETFYRHFVAGKVGDQARVGEP